MMGDWIDEMEQDLAGCLCDTDTISPSELGVRLGISESSAVSLICLLAADGRVTIERVSLSCRAAGQGYERDRHDRGVGSALGAA